MYGSDDRVNNALKAKGFTETYISNDFGKMKAREVWKGFVSEKQAVKLVEIATTSQLVVISG